MVICQGCLKEVDYLKEPEVGMGYIVCPHCKRLIDQTGKVIGEKIVDDVDKCKRCGQCCRIKTTILGAVFYSNKYCPYLVFEKDGRAACTIYKDRYEKAKWCLPVEKAIEQGLVPNDCGYVPAGYKSKIKEKVDLE